VLAIFIFLLSKFCTNHDHKKLDSEEDEVVKRGD